jgi:N-acylneuraminate cytidylyltransferase/CMP-N,N'-diacetyllegionaminic acid synthase
MYKGKKILALIPARAKSSRLPNKNILSFCGKPLICWSIEAAKNSNYIDKIIISSDSEKIGDIAKGYNVPFHKRKESLSKDDTPSIDVIMDILAKERGFDYLILLQPTSPLRGHKDIDKAIEFLFFKNANSIISVSPSFPPFWINALPENLSMEDFLKEEKMSHQLPAYYALNGAIFISKISTLLEEKSFYQKKRCYAFVMEKKKSIDIDDIEDFEIAECLMEKAKEK